MSRPDLSLVLACYNEAEHLEASVRALQGALARMRVSHELIFIDDGSRDGTPELLRKFGRERPEYRIVLHERNVGRGGTVSEGIRMASGRIAGYLDIDLEVPACHLLSMMSLFDEGDCDAVIGRRIYRVHLTPFALMRHTAHVVYKALAARLLPVPVSDSEAGFKFFDRDRIVPVLDGVRDVRWFWDTEVVVRAQRAGLRLRELPCLYSRNLDKTSTVRVVPDTLEYLRQLRRLKRELRRAPPR
jgi:glycosyltransferase involved in cell wall biosynthesis